LSSGTNVFWILLAAFVALIAVGVVAALLGRFLYLRQVKRSLVRLAGRREGVIAAAKGLELVLEHLLSADDATLSAFANDPASEDRRALEDVASRMRIVADDLHALALPKRLWPVAEAIETAARTIATQAGGVGEAEAPDDVLAALAAVRISEINAAMAAADAALDPLLTAFDVRDPAVYGGGLYI
jgi:hypothetical protein